MNPRLVVFDFDGTLADSAGSVMRAFNESAGRFGYRRLDDAEIAVLRGQDNRAIIRALGVPMWKLPMIARHMRRRIAEDAGSILLFPGAAAMLRELSAQGAVLAIVTSNEEATVCRILGPELAGLFAMMECRALLFGKAPLMRRVLRRTGLPAEAAIAIGDEARDIEAARKAGIASGAVAWGYATPELLRSRNPTIFLERMEDVAGALFPISRVLPPPGSPAATAAAPQARG
ncbi:HAD hydrolase-like protein [Roseomonas xinghualingensis]|uniref:HAD hydrolase-like protein n=1 Tax=Roseomonas xinghualingensis TaxID=2986475 RepID=UPI0021F21219|nr:HAD hydrolase-like protein [Roseomonas sp. SXEYE001]MCV4208130.1 HAD hydrolase-like protein [Roseomonas sp. SXEYE001]